MYRHRCGYINHHSAADHEVYIVGRSRMRQIALMRAIYGLVMRKEGPESAFTECAAP